MEENQKSAFQSSLISGLYLGIVLIVFSLITYLFDLPYDSKVNYISYLVMAGGLFWAMITFRDKQQGGFLSYGKAFAVGFWTLLFASILGAVYMYVYVTVINPGMVEDIMINSEVAILESSPDISDEQLEQAMSITEMFTSPIAMTVMTFVSNLIFGSIIALIIAIFVKREDKSLT